MSELIDLQIIFFFKIKIVKHFQELIKKRTNSNNILVRVIYIVTYLAKQKLAFC
jgi:hypothetical protein